MLCKSYVQNLDQVHHIFIELHSNIEHTRSNQTNFQLKTEGFPNAHLYFLPRKGGWLVLTVFLLSLLFFLLLILLISFLIYSFFLPYPSFSIRPGYFLPGLVGFFHLFLYFFLPFLFPSSCFS